MFRVSGFELRVPGFGIRVSGLGGLGLGIWGLGLGFGVWGLGLGVKGQRRSDLQACLVRMAAWHPSTTCVRISVSNVGELLVNVEGVASNLLGNCLYAV